MSRNAKVGGAGTTAANRAARAERRGPGSSLRGIAGPWASPALTAGDILALQRTAGNTAVSALLVNRPGVVPASAGSPVVQRVATGLVAGLKEDDPTTYDSGGGHSYADHGAQTTKEQHVNRVKTGVAPSGRVSKVPRGKGSSKFASNDKHKEAFTTAYADLKTKNENKQKVRGAANVLALGGAGTLYFADETEAASDKVQLDIVPVDDTTIRINSMYPVG